MAESEERPLRITAIMDTLAVSGPGKQLAAVIPALADLNVLVRPLVYRPEGLQEHPYATYLSDLGLAFDSVETRGSWDRRMVARTGSVLAATNPDILQTHGYRPTAVATALGLCGIDLPWVAFFHGSTTENLRVRLFHLLDGLLMLRADQIVVVSSSQVDRFRNPKRPVKVLTNAILDTSVTEIDDPRLPDTEEPRIAVVGRLSSEKGVDRFLDAMALVERPFQAAIVGDGPDGEELRERNRDLGLDDRVHFVGRMDPVGPVYRWADLVVIPSRSEGMPNVLLEAIQYGTPVVATDVGNIAEIIGGTGLGEVVTSGEPRSLSSAVSRVLSRIGRESDGGAGSPEKNSLREGQRKAILDRFSLARRAGAHRRLYDEVLGLSAAGRTIAGRH